MKTRKELIQEAIEEFEQKIIILQLCISSLRVESIKEEELSK